MRKLYLAAIVICAFAAAISFLPSQTSGKNQKFLRSKKPIPNRYIVVLNDTNLPDSDEETGNAVSRLAREYRGNVHNVYTRALKGYAAEMSEDEALRLSDDPLVKYVEEDSVIEAQQTTQTNATWGISRIDQRSFVNPLDTNYNYGTSGKGVNVYVMDNGILTTNVDFEGRAFNAFDAYPSDPPVSQCDGHGTHVAGTIGSKTYGVAKNVLIYSVKILPCYGSGTTATAIAGIDWINHNAIRPAVVNLSAATTTAQSLDDAVKNSIASGITYVVAAGNYSSDACGYSPARLPEAITVSSTGPSDSWVSTTNYGACVDIFAPGANITSLGNASDTAISAMSGTSTSAPHVAGAVALYLEANPTASPQQVSDALRSKATVNAIYNLPSGSSNLLLYSYTDPVGSGDPSPTPTPTPTPIPTPTPTPTPAPTPGSSCSGTNFNGSVASGLSSYQSSTQGFSARNGNYLGTLSVPLGTQLKLYLEKKKGSKWSSVANSPGGTSAQTISYAGSSGSYRWRVLSLSGSGNYSLCSTTP